jgi:hypothetical protein
MQPTSAVLETNLSHTRKHLEDVKHFKEIDTLEDNHSGHSSRMNLMSKDELHPVNLLTFVFNVEVSPHVCSFCHGFGHLLVSCPYRSSRVEVQLGLLITLPLRNPLIIMVLRYPNIVLRNFSSHLDINGDKGEFLGCPNPIGNFFPSPKAYGSFLALASM